MLDAKIIMKKLIPFLIIGIILFSNIIAWSMIDFFTFKVIGKVIQISEQPIEDKQTKPELLKKPYYLQLEILSVIPTEKDLTSWAGGYHTYLEALVNINQLNFERDITIDKLQQGNIIIGTLSSERVEIDEYGYRISNSLMVEEIFREKNVREYFIKKLYNMKKLLNSNNLSAKINVVIIARKYNLKAFAPIILNTLNNYYPQGKWEPRETWNLYKEGIETFEVLKYKEANSLLKKIINDEENLKKIGANFKNIQGCAHKALEGLGK